MRRLKMLWEYLSIVLTMERLGHRDAEFMEYVSQELQRELHAPDG